MVVCIFFYILLPISTTITFWKTLLKRFQDASTIPSGDKLVAISLPLICGAYLTEAYFRTSLSDADTSSECRYPPISAIITESHVQELERDGMVVIPNVLPRTVLRQTRQDIQRIARDRNGGGDWENGEVVHQEEEHQNHNRSIASQSSSELARGDVVCWLRPSDGHAKINEISSNTSSSSTLGDGIYHCINILRGTTYALETNHYTTSHSHRIPQQCQLASYPGDNIASYPRHSDHCSTPLTELGLLEYWRLSDYRGRCITCILYLNDEHWDEQNDGGALRCYDMVNKTEEACDDDEKKNRKEACCKDREHSDEKSSYRDVPPVGGSLLIFDARRIEHEVLPSKRERVALTSWVNGETPSIH